MTTEPGGRSLQRRLLASMAAGFAVLLLLISLLLWAYARGAANRTYDLLLAGAALAILERTSIAPEGPTVDLPHSAMEILALNPHDRVAYRVFSPRHGEITGTETLPEPGRALDDLPYFYDANFGGASFRFVSQGRRLTAPEGREWVGVQIGQTVEARRAQQWSLFLNGMAGLAAVSLIGLGFVWLAIRRSLAPLRQIETELRHREPADLSRVEGTPPREIRGLFDAINGFIARLGQSRALTESFIADVAHQTRTSLSALQGHLSLATDAPNLDQMRARVSKADRQAQRTVRLTNQLLANAMVIHRSDQGSLAPLALRSMVRDTLAEQLRDSRLRHIALSFEDEGLRDGHDRIMGDPVSIREALRNLIDNAVRHGPAENTITVGLTEHGDEVWLSVEDAGPGISEADLPRATQRFTSISTETAGSGLGLSIVSAVAKGHAGRLELGRSPLGGLRAAIVFPRLIALLLCLLGISLAPPAARAETLSIFSATDGPAMAPLIAAFEERNPGVRVSYSEFQTVGLHRALLDISPGLVPDLVVSSAMDLQVDLVNRGLARQLDIPDELRPPDWATWRSELFGFTFEPAAIAYDRRLFDEEDLPRSHRDLASFVRDNETKLAGRIGGYDLRGSGIGYLFATQDSIQGPQAQRLTEAFGRAGMRRYCCTSQMVAATASGEIALAFNAIGSYAAAFASDTPEVGLHFLDDYNLVMTRTGFVPKAATRPDLGARFLLFMLSDDGQRLLTESTPLIPIRPPGKATAPILQKIDNQRSSFLPIRLGPGLLTYLDELKREQFLSGWEASLGKQ
ncbi:sensor histidine kinase (plasmid) [Limimaricola variabilis]